MTGLTGKNIIEILLQVRDIFNFNMEICLLKQESTQIQLSVLSIGCIVDMEKVLIITQKVLP